MLAHSMAPDHTDDSDTLELLMKQYAGRLKSVGYRVLGDVHLAEDIMQETLIRAWKNMDGLDEGSNISGWLYTIAYRVSIDYRRKTQKQQLYYDALEQASAEESPESAVMRNETHHTIWNAIDDFEDHYRMPLVLFYQHDWTLQKIADHLKLKVPAVKSRLYRSKKALRMQLENIDIV